MSKNSLVVLFVFYKPFLLSFFFFLFHQIKLIHLNPMADEAKAKGNTAFSSGDYPTAIHYFSDAIALAPTNHVLKMRTCFAMGGDGHRNHHFTETVAMGGIGPTMGLVDIGKCEEG